MARILVVAHSERACDREFRVISVSRWFVIRFEYVVVCEDYDAKC